MKKLGEKINSEDTEKTSSDSNDSLTKLRIITVQTRADKSYLDIASNYNRGLQ